ncbi:hypothetical protein DKY63_29120 [Pseudomonas putida]|uniref:Uncharacterized protein n=1 Tax=Pseudomonas putida TaxID=303 RepID=A0A2Z4RRI5_PSEPU|nr:hypothetical protein [Pseudomonas putida]AWY43763.1 hypothetical protein DKY63_29120 [Pseudomonas putida]
MKITEVSVIKAARAWSAKNGQNEEQAAAEAADAIGKLRFRFTGDQYQRELESLYQRYAES